MNKSQVTILRKRLMSISEGIIDAVASNDTDSKDRKILEHNRLLLEVISVLMHQERTMEES